jgi:hypothetical protein
MTQVVMPGRRAATEAERTGPIGRTARLVLAAVLSASLLSLLDQGGVVGFRNPSVPTEFSVWLLTAFMVAGLATLVGAIASADQRRSPWPWRLGTLALLATAAVAAAAIGQLTAGNVWGFPLADLVWWFDVVMLVQTVVALLIAIGIGTPGCEVGVWPALVARMRGGGWAPVAGPACVIGLHFVDTWEARRHSADKESRAGSSR